MHGPVLRAWMLESVRPATQHAERPGRWVAEPVWPPAEQHELRLYFNETGLESQPGAVAPRVLCSPETTGEYGGRWCSLGSCDSDEERCHVARSVEFQSPPLEDLPPHLRPPVLPVRI